MSYPQSSATPSETSPSEFKIYRPPTSAVVPQLRELPESFFTPTTDEIKVSQATLASRAQALNNAPLQLRATRQAAEKAKKDRWPNTTIRIRFSDRTQLEKVFSSSDRIQSVYTFVCASLRDDLKFSNFILYQSPPKREFKLSDPKVRGLTLAELQLAPSSVLLVRFEDDLLNRTGVPAPLLPSIVAQAIELPTPPTFEDSTKSQQSTPSKAKTGSDKEKKVPKWFKTGRSK
ncbi:hypothetical protein SCLCIDRAFT_15272 [Scleroderma citrinum Foug A]|uniref:UBX domain-containing protein n=1 Tax=Scleroderma citrinum Foug A TaxID=1036808 RepID=A0A0C3DUG3_9AGAM|nr:hypothetical protein SCLCIDRAFT_15272 [Scleroderma citrinum Foug A]